MKTETLFESLKEWAAAANFVTQQDLQRLEARLDELLALADDLEARLATDGSTKTSAKTGGGKPPPPRP